MAKLFSLWRWQGFIIFIIILVALFFSIPGFIKKALESSLEASFEAKSYVGKVELDYAASELRIVGLKVADKESPMMNLFEWQSSTVSISFLSALNGRFIVNDMSVKGLKFATPREYSGVIKTSRNKQQKKDQNKGESLDSLKRFKPLPSADVLLAREPIKTQQLADDFINYSEQKNQQWDSLNQQLPDKAKLKDYQLRIDELKQLKIKNISDFNNAANSLKFIKNNLKKDKAQLTEAKQFIRRVAETSTHKLQALKNAPAEDFKHLRSKYELSQGGALNVAGLLLGNELETYARKALSVYNRIQPLMTSSETEPDQLNTQKVERLRGHFIHFDDEKPSVWIKHISVDGEYDAYQFEAELKHLSHQPSLINKPASLRLNTLQNDSTQEAFEFTAEVDYRFPDKHKESAAIKLSNFPVSQWEIIKDKNLQVEIERSILDASAQVQRSFGRVNGQGHADFKRVEFNNSGNSKFTQEVASAIAGVSDFDVQLNFADDLSNLIIHSNLDDQISAAINSRMRQQQKMLEKKLKIGINQELQRALKNKQLALVLDSEASLDQQLNQVEVLLKQELDDFSKRQKIEQKKKAKQQVDKHKNKLKSKLKSLF